MELTLASSRQGRNIRLNEMTPCFDREQSLAGVKAKRPVAPAHRRHQQPVDQLVERFPGVRFAQEQPHAMKENAGDGLVIAFAVAVNPADALVEASNEAGQILVEI